MKKILINSLPKAGTHLTGKCFELLGYSSSGHIGGSLVFSKEWRARYRRILYSHVRPGYIVGIDTPVEVSKYFIDRILNATKENQYCSAHVGYTSDILYSADKMGFSLFVIIRDPRAVLSSFIPYVLKNKDHLCHTLFHTMKSDDRYLLALKGFFDRKASLQPLRIRCQALDPWLSNSNVLKIRFEDLVGPGGGGSKEKQIKTLTEICNRIDAPESKVAYVASKLFGSSKGTFRKGQIDSWKSEIPEKVLSKVEDELGDILVQWGYTD